MINAEQIRIARAILDWSTADLAQLSGLTTNGINKIERGHVVPHQDTLRTLQIVFENAGLEFLPFSGVKKKDQILQVWEDEEACERVLDDVYYELRDTGGEVLISGVDETSFTSGVRRDRVESHLERLALCGITERRLIKEGDTKLIGPVETYHWVQERYFSTNPITIYGAKVALAVWETPRKVVIIHDARIADSLKHLFNFVWDHTKEPA